MAWLRISASVSVPTGLQDLVGHPGRGSLGLIDLHRGPSNRNLLGAALSQLDICVAIGCLQSGLEGRLSGEDPDLLPLGVSQG